MACVCFSALLSKIIHDAHLMTCGGGQGTPSTPSPLGANPPALRGEPTVPTLRQASILPAEQLQLYQQMVGFLINSKGLLSASFILNLLSEYLACFAICFTVLPYGRSMAVNIFVLVLRGLV